MLFVFKTLIMTGLRENDLSSPVVRKMLIGHQKGSPGSGERGMPPDTFTSLGDLIYWSSTPPIAR